MPQSEPDRKRHLPKLARQFYRGQSFIHWTLTTENRKTGWLADRFHHAFREVLLHAAVRYRLCCPAYTILPDHMHVLWLGMAADSDQKVAVAFLRKHLKPYLRPADWQAQPHDHVLREQERERGAFQSIAWYILENPVRAGLAAEPRGYRFSGCVVPGYPALTPFRDGYWDLYWRIDNRMRKQGQVSLQARASDPPL